MAATIALSILAAATIIGGCTQSVPSVVSATPDQEARNVSVSPAVVGFTFDQSMNRRDVEKAFSITPSVGSTAPKCTWSGGGRILTVTLPQPLRPDTEYTAKIASGARSDEGVSIGKPFVMKFTTVRGRHAVGVLKDGAELVSGSTASVASK
jgi:hypothetical protein